MQSVFEAINLTSFFFGSAYIWADGIANAEKGGKRFNRKFRLHYSGAVRRFFFYQTAERSAGMNVSFRLFNRRSQDVFDLQPCSRSTILPFGRSATGRFLQTK